MTGESARKLADLSDFALGTGPGMKRQEFVDLAGSMYEMRRLRSRFLCASVLGEPVWDMLLALYCFTARGEALSVTGLCYSAGAPPTTALRWLQLLEQKKLIDRIKDSRDARRVIVSLSAVGEEMMTDYLAAVHKRMLAERLISPHVCGPPIA